MSKCWSKSTHCVESKQGYLGTISLNGKSLYGPLKVQVNRPRLE